MRHKPSGETLDRSKPGLNRPGRFALGQQIGRVGVRSVGVDVLQFLPAGRVRDCLHESDGFGDVLIRSLCRLPLSSQYAIV